MPLRPFLFGWLCALSLISPVLASETVRFEHTASTPWGQSLYVLGDVAELGGGDPRHALRMVPGPGDRWSLSVALPAGASFRFSYVVRLNDPSLRGEPWNAERRTGILQGQAPGAASERAVRVRYASGWARVVLRYRRGPGRVEELELRRAGPGRHGAESLWEGTVQTSLPRLECVFHDGHGHTDRAEGGAAYQTGYADLIVQDGRVHDGRHVGPTALPAVSAGEQGQVVVVRGWYSQRLGNARDVFVYLPRGYGRSSRRYPVLYVQDGQNLFGPDALFGGWRLEQALERGIGSGAIADLIVIGVGNTSARMQEYLPPEDGGHADRYGEFLARELKPWVDASLRTRPEPEHTGVLGSSLGGLVSVYLGWTRPDVFGRAGSLSGSFWLDGFLNAQLTAGARPALRLWLDSGTAGATADGYEGTLYARDLLLRRGFVLGGDLRHTIDDGAGHNEAAWRARVGDALAALFPAE